MCAYTALALVAYWLKATRRPSVLMEPPREPDRRAGRQGTPAAAASRKNPTNLPSANLGWRWGFRG